MPFRTGFRITIENMSDEDFGLTLDRTICALEVRLQTPAISMPAGAVIEPGSISRAPIVSWIGPGDRFYTSVHTLRSESTIPGGRGAGEFKFSHR